jgi:hypothetical protein
MNLAEYIQLCDWLAPNVRPGNTFTYLGQRMVVVSTARKSCTGTNRHSLVVTARYADTTGVIREIDIQDAEMVWLVARYIAE